MSGIVESGRESGHGDIDANDPERTFHNLQFSPISIENAKDPQPVWTRLWLSAVPF